MDFFSFSVMDSHRSGMRVRTRYVHSLSSLINIIRMQLLLAGATMLSDLLVFFFSSHRFFLFILHSISICAHRVDNRWWLRTIARCSGFNRRERNDAMCISQEDAIIIIVLLERTREISFSLFSSIFRLFMGFGCTSACIQLRRLHVCFQDVRVCVCRGKKRNRNFFFFFVLIECWRRRQNGLCVRMRKKYLAKESKSCNEWTTTDDRSIGNSESSTFLSLVFYYRNTWMNFLSRHRKKFWSW